MTEKKTEEEPIGAREFLDQWMKEKGYAVDELIGWSIAADFAEAYAAQQFIIPYRCPVCGGNGIVPNGFYNTVTGICSTTSIIPETCRTCNGSGVFVQQSKMPTEPLDRWDAEAWLGKERDIWHHPRISDRTDANSYEVADLLIDFVNSLSGFATK